MMRRTSSRWRMPSTWAVTPPAFESASSHLLLDVFRIHADFRAQLDKRLGTIFRIIGVEAKEERAVIPVERFLGDPRVIVNHRGAVNALRRVIPGALEQRHLDAIAAAILAQVERIAERGIVPHPQPRLHDLVLHALR